MLHLRAACACSWDAALFYSMLYSGMERCHHKFILTTVLSTGKVHKMRMELRSGDATYESWRYLESGVMVVKSIFSGKGRCVPCGTPRH